jgi:hypothetical protein
MASGKRKAPGAWSSSEGLPAKRLCVRAQPMTRGIVASGLVGTGNTQPAAFLSGHGFTIFGVCSQRWVC